MVQFVEGDSAVLARETMATQALATPMMQPSAPPGPSDAEQRLAKLWRSLSRAWQSAGVYGLQIAEQRVAKLVWRVLNLAVVSVFLNLLFMFLQGEGTAAGRGLLLITVYVVLIVSFVAFACGWRGVQMNSTKPLCIFRGCQILAALLDTIQLVELLVEVFVKEEETLSIICLVIVVSDLIVRCIVLRGSKQLFAEVKQGRVIHHVAEQERPTQWRTQHDSEAVAAEPQQPQAHPVAHSEDSVVVRTEAQQSKPTVATPYLV